MKVYPLGYARSGYKVEQMMARDSKLLIIDLRKSPNSSMLDWAKPALEAQYGHRYRWAGRYLGNVNHANNGPIQLADPATGIKGLVQYLSEGHDLILLCGCAEYDACHRKVVVELLVAQLPAVEVVQPEDVPADPVIIVTMRGKPSKPRTRMTDPGSKVFVALNGQDIPAIVLESRPSFNGDYRNCKLKVAVYNAISRQWLVSVYPKPVQSHKLRKRYKDIPELDKAN
jgi:hypothetical protein